MIATLLLSTTLTYNCPPKYTQLLSEECRAEVLAAMNASQTTRLYRQLTEDRMGMEQCSANEDLRWKFREDLAPGPLLEVEQIYDCDPASGYMGYRIGGRYHLERPYFEFLKVELRSLGDQ